MRLIHQCLNKQLTDICQRSAQLHELNSLVRNYLKPSLRDHCQVGSFNKGCLILVVDAVWATELRYELPALRDRLRNEAALYQLIAIEINILAALSEQRLDQLTPVKKTIPLSANAKQAILALVKQCAHTPLQEALQRLVENSE